jgi:hypothetical protein
MVLDAVPSVVRSSESYDFALHVVANLVEELFRHVERSVRFAGGKCDTTALVYRIETNISQLY